MLGMDENFWYSSPTNRRRQPLWIPAVGPLLQHGSPDSCPAYHRLQSATVLLIDTCRSVSAASTHSSRVALLCSAKRFQGSYSAYQSTSIVTPISRRLVSSPIALNGVFQVLRWPFLTRQNLLLSRSKVPMAKHVPIWSFSCQISSVTIR